MYNFKILRNEYINTNLKLICRYFLSIYPNKIYLNM